MIRSPFSAALLAVALFVSVSSVAFGDNPRQRNFSFDYGVTINGVTKGDEVRIWLPIPRNEHGVQNTKMVSSTLPGEGKETREEKYGNRMIYRSLKADSDEPISASVTYEIQRQEVKGLEQPGKAPALGADRERLYLSANRRVPIKGIPLTWNRNLKDVVETARDIYERVDAHVRYDKSKPGYGNGDVMWVCDSKFGNCTDFHSLFISMARASNIPARFEIGFPLPTDKTTGTIGGYHCWANFYTHDHEWVPVDISEADKHPELKEYYFGSLTPDRVSFTVGRDIDLAPKQSGEPLNYFVYPYVEINGKKATKEQLALKFEFKDMKVNEQN